ncbi:MAG TPA: uridine diphosphate-N-acetylglucosamine-binding protein YvcK [Caldisericia bacterium]|nr:uridine diphosphate-N-acetylglucosamine-binding protein YvcK [Caldisericia bacterium]HPC56738.1 uridine diphosphate-N-acetylglucosamine-binding protein YvcK [Caldisericia bacterium]HPP43370.1 uridine diphosphate-N-acetylglucosamine-binding protein YvcK [Caldisericia bacterium]HRT36860.1 uridine diphosphate-N-acetylglucosamine-binding protein YvcK [Caldisericia bacterium]HRU73721.1 uridine diphosphate-N-acetylglucosamine-binding protein YvcK [Caldisericia bacterium]
MNKDKIKGFFKWLYPGMNIKRWILLMIIGLIILLLGLMVILDFTRLGIIKRYVIDYIIIFMKGNYTFPVWLTRLIALLYMILGIFLIIFGFSKLMNSLFTALLKEKRNEVVNIVHDYRFKSKVKKVVACGGGTGLSTILRGLKEYPFYPVAIVTVTDDGGSSGKLREELGIPPPGDLRNCIIALSESEEFLKDLFQYRFKEGETLQGHSIGNLIIAGSIKLKDSLIYGITKLEETLNLSGKVLPVSESIITLRGEFEDGEVVLGETNIRNRGKKIKKISLEPFYAKPAFEVLYEIETSELIIIGPGSLYTSIIPPLLFPSVVESIKKSKAKKIYILNLMTEKGETDDFTASMHVQKIYEHTGENIFDYIIVNNGKIGEYYLDKYKKVGSYPVEIDEENLKKLGLKIIKDDIVTVENGYLRHNYLKIRDLLKDMLKWKK